MMGRVLATSPCNKSQGLVACELAIFATKFGLRLDFEAKRASSHDASGRRD